MKKIIGVICAGLLVCVLGAGCYDGGSPDADMTQFIERGEVQAQKEFYYYYHGERTDLSLNTRRAFFSLREPRLPDDITRLGAAIGFTEDRVDDRYHTQLTFKNKLSAEQYLKLLAGIRTVYPQIIVQPCFGDDEGVCVSNIFYVKLKKEDDLALLEQTGRQFNCRIVEDIPFTPLWYIMCVTEETQLFSTECAALLYETGLFADIDPAFMFSFAPGR